MTLFCMLSGFNSLLLFWNLRAQPFQQLLSLLITKLFCNWFLFYFNAILMDIFALFNIHFIFFETQYFKKLPWKLNLRDELHLKFDFCIYLKSVSVCSSFPQIRPGPLSIRPKKYWKSYEWFWVFRCELF